MRPMALLIGLPGWIQHCLQILDGRTSAWASPSGSAAKMAVMVHSEGVLRSEDPARTLNNEISELQARVAFPQHWSSGEHAQHIEKLRQLQYQKKQLVFESRQAHMERNHY